MLYSFVLSVFLEGCAVWTPLPDACLPLPFRVLNHTDGIISKTLAGQIPDIQCPAGFMYAGPKLECGMRAKVCLAAKASTIDERRCFYDYEFVVLGTALKTWPRHAKPILMSPFLTIEGAQMKVRTNHSTIERGEVEMEETDDDNDDDPDVVVMALGFGFGARRLKMVLPRNVDSDELSCTPAVPGTPVLLPQPQASSNLLQNILSFGGDHASFIFYIGFLVAGMLLYAVVCQRRRLDPSLEEPLELHAAFGDRSQRSMELISDR